MPKAFLYFLSVLFFVSACTNKSEVDEIIDKAISNSCNGNCENSVIEFEFRGKEYTSERNGGLFTFTSSFTDSTGMYVDVLDNSGFTRYLNEEKQNLPDSMSQKFSNSLNSVHYFFQLPYGLDAPAVKKRRIGTDTIKNQVYHVIEISFEQEGGGEDFEDVFYYWVNTESYFVDYLAYQYHTNGGGIRFREAINPRMISGIRVVDYLNYKPKKKETTLSELSSLFQQGELQLLSKIENEKVRITTRTPAKN